MTAEGKPRAKAPGTAAGMTAGIPADMVIDTT
ncbi:MAG TPA: hypothetical protein DEF41_06970 [Desulfovibrio sp.]|nr:hypothetical protein [Desulfovibrio sp.]